MRVEQDSQRINTNTSSPRNKKNKKTDKTLHASEPVIDTPENPNDISISDAETVGDHSRNLKFSTHHQDQSMESSSNERERGVHLHTLVDRERKRSRERG